MPDQAEKGEMFCALHRRDGAFLLPNPADVGSARLLELLGFEALATTSAGFAFTRGRRDNAVPRREMMRHIREIADVSDLPLSADLENGFGDSPEEVAQTVRDAALAGAVGGSIEDSTGRSDEPLYPIEEAAERVRAAACAARALPFSFTLTARAENFLVGRPDLGDVISRLQAYQDAGANVLYAPGLKDPDQIRSVVRSVDRPVSVVMGLVGSSLSQGELSSIGVRRISVGSALARLAYGAVLRAAREMLENGTFTFADQAVGFADISEMFAAAPSVAASIAKTAESPARP